MAPTDTPLPVALPIEPIVHLNIPISTKLSQSNYLTWKAQVLPLINGHNLDKHITSPPPSTTIQNNDGSTVTNPNFSHWNRQDQSLLGWLRTSLSDTVQGQVVSCATTYELWIFLQQTFSATCRARRSDLKRQIQTTTRGSSTCTDFLQRLRRIADELSFIGSPLSDDDLVTTVLNGLGPEFNSFTVSITTSARNEAISFADLQGMLLSYENLLLTQNQLSTVSVPSLSTPTAFYNRFPSPNPNPGTYRPPRPGFNRSPRPQFRSQNQNPLLPNPPRQ